MEDFLNNVQIKFHDTIEFDALFQNFCKFDTGGILSNITGMLWPNQKYFCKPFATPTNIEYCNDIRIYLPELKIEHDYSSGYVKKMTHRNFQSDSNVEVIKFETSRIDNVRQSSIYDPEKAGLGYYHNTFWIPKGKYYYPCTGSGVFLQTGNVLIALNKLHALFLMGVSFDELKKLIIYNDIPSFMGSELSDSYLKSVNNWSASNSFNFITNNVKGMKEAFIRSKLETVDQFLKRCLGLGFLNTSEQYSEYTKIYDASFNQLSLDYLVYTKAKQSNYNQVVLFGETSECGVDLPEMTNTGCEIIDIEPTPLSSFQKLLSCTPDNASVIFDGKYNKYELTYNTQGLGNNRE